MSIDLCVIQNGTLTGLRYRYDITDPIIRPDESTAGDNFILMDDNGRPS